MALGDMSCFWYAISSYQKLKDLNLLQIKQISKECDELTQKYPLQNYHNHQFKISFFPELLTGLKVISLLAVSTDILSGYQLSKREMSFKWLSEAKQFVDLENKTKPSLKAKKLPKRSKIKTEVLYGTKKG